jgi:hypothetical protein
MDNVCDRRTEGPLFRRHVQIGEIVAIGKEPNKLEEVDAGLVHSAESVYTTYLDETRSLGAIDQAEAAGDSAVKPYGRNRTVLENVD